MSLIECDYVEPCKNRGCVTCTLHGTHPPFSFCLTCEHCKGASDSPELIGSKLKVQRETGRNYGVSVSQLSRAVEVEQYIIDRLDKCAACTEECIVRIMKTCQRRNFVNKKAAVCLKGKWDESINSSESDSNSG